MALRPLGLLLGVVTASNIASVPDSCMIEYVPRENVKKTWKILLYCHLEAAIHNYRRVDIHLGIVHGSRISSYGYLVHTIYTVTIFLAPILEFIEWNSPTTELTHWFRGACFRNV